MFGNYQWSFDKHSWQVKQKEKERGRNRETWLQLAEVNSRVMHIRELILQMAFLAFSYATVLSLATSAWRGQCVKITRFAVDIDLSLSPRPSLSFSRFAERAWERRALSVARKVETDSCVGRARSRNQREQRASSRELHDRQAVLCLLSSFLAKRRFGPLNDTVVARGWGEKTERERKREVVWDSKSGRAELAFPFGNKKIRVLDGCYSEYVILRGIFWEWYCLEHVSLHACVWMIYR